jgi:undecaprenyl-diphosphatase
MRRRILAVLVVLALAWGVVTVAFAPANDPREAENMTLLEAAVLGTVEGLTEYLPVSSTGHLLVTQRAMGIGTADEARKGAADAFAVAIQAGAILAVLGLYFGRVRQIGRGLLGRDPAGLHLGAHLLVAFLPAAVVGLTLGDAIKEHLFGPWPIVGAWAVGGLAILLVAWFKREGTEEGRAGLAIEALTVRLALGIGLWQCVAVWPGVSRSLVTILGGVVLGLSLRAAVEFSFLLGLLTLGAATIHDGVRHADLLTATYSPPALVVGLCFAFVSAVLAVRWLVGYLQSHGLQLFGWYRLAIAAVVAVLLWQGVL